MSEGVTGLLAILERFAPVATLIYASLALGGCGMQAAPQQEPSATAKDTATHSAIQRAPSLRPVDTLAGAWRVAGIDGKSLNEPYGLALSADDTEIWAEPRCMGLVSRYVIDGLRATITRPPRGGPPPPPGTAAPPACAIAPPPRLGEVRRALDAADRVGRTPENGVLISGGGHSLLLFSQ